MAGKQARIARSVQVGVGVSLTAVAGFVDAVGYIELGGFFASFMSGASISLGVGVGESRWAAVQHAGILVTAFVAAATAASMISGLMRRWALPTVLLLDGGCISAAALMAGTGWTPSVAVIPVVAAMGVQNTALRPVDGVRLGVTFMTGTLVSLSEALGRCLLGRAPWWGWSPHALVWCSFVAGAGAGALLHRALGFLALAAPAVVVSGMGGFIAFAVLAKARKRQRSTADLDGT
jgi:uncharacterized membrane protein YoaK (UPF0700 family)